MSNNTVFEKLQRIETNITKLTTQEDSIRDQIKVLRAEHASLIQSFLAQPHPTQKTEVAEAAKAAEEVSKVQDPTDRHALAVQKASTLVRKVLSAHPRGLGVDDILTSIGILTPSATNRYDLEALLAAMTRAGQVKTVSTDGVHFRFILETPSQEVPTPQPAPVVESKMGPIMWKISNYYRAGRRVVTTSDLFPLVGSFPMASVRHTVMHTLVSLGVLSHTSTAHTYNILRDPCMDAVPRASAPKVERTAQELDDLYVQAVSKIYHAKGPAIRAEDFEKLDIEGCQKYPLQVMSTISRLLRTGVLVPLGGSHYKAVSDPLAPAMPSTPPTAATAPAPTATTKVGRLHPSSHGDYPPGVHLLTRELLDHMRADAAQTYSSTTYTIDDVVSWLGSRGVSSANIRTRASHILASLVGFGCLNRAGSGKYTLRDYRGYKIPQTTQEK